MFLAILFPPTLFLDYFGSLLNCRTKTPFTPLFLPRKINVTDRIARILPNSILPQIAYIVSQFIFI